MLCHVADQCSCLHFLLFLFAAVLDIDFLSAMLVVEAADTAPPVAGHAHESAM